MPSRAVSWRLKSGSGHTPSPNLQILAYIARNPFFLAMQAERYAAENEAPSFPDWRLRAERAARMTARE
jgi:hypothetical protein